MAAASGVQCCLCTRGEDSARAHLSRDAHVSLPRDSPPPHSGFCWTLLYDTIYAHQDKTDDLKLGIGSTALHLADQTKQWLAVFSVGTIGCLAFAGAAVQMPLIYYACLVGGTLQLGWQVGSVNLDNRVDCLRKFRSNHHFGAIIFAAIVAGKVLASHDERNAVDEASSANDVAVDTSIQKDEVHGMPNAKCDQKASL